MVTAGKVAGFLQTFGQDDNVLLNIVEQGVPESGNYDDPDDDAVRAQGVDAVDALKEQPMYKAQSKDGSNL